MNAEISLFHQTLFSWWREHGRILPWREKTSYQRSVISYQESAQKTVELHHGLSVREKVFESYFSGKFKRDPYRVVVSEVMLQQTQVDSVLPKYEAWMEKWPTIQDVAQASLSEVLIEWKGLGYNRRARFLWVLAKEIIEQRQGEWPESEQELLTLPGVGKYTARAILSFAFGKPVGVVDTNVKRVLGRWFGLEKLSNEWKRMITNKNEYYFNDQTDDSLQETSSLKMRNLIEKICEKELLSKSTEKEWF